MNLIQGELQDIHSNPELPEILKTLTKYEKDIHGKKFGIYLIKLGDLIYIGQTLTSFNERFSSHKRALGKALLEIIMKPFNPFDWQSETLYITMAQYGFAKRVSLENNGGISLRDIEKSVKTIIDDLEFYLIETYDNEDFKDKNKYTLKKAFYNKEHEYIKKYQSVRYGFNQFEILEFIRTKIRQNKPLNYKEYQQWKDLLLDYLYDKKELTLKIKKMASAGINTEEGWSILAKEFGTFYHNKVIETSEKINNYISSSINLDYEQLIKSISFIQTVEELQERMANVKEEQEDFN